MLHLRRLHTTLIKGIACRNDATRGCSDRDMLRTVFSAYSRQARLKRAKMLLESIVVDPAWRVLDLGGGTGDHINLILPDHRNVVVADLLPEELSVARERYGYQTVQFDGSGTLPFADKQFDLVFCSSVIEHVTGPKANMIATREGKDFQRVAWQHQRAFAQEIRRISRRYYVQTPHKYFIIESHSWLPGIIVAMPRPTQIKLLEKISQSRLWPKATLPDWHLLTPATMQDLFPDAEIKVERSFGFPKSIMAMKN